jgi:hypothetical protein
VLGEVLGPSHAELDPIHRPQHRRHAPAGAGGSTLRRTHGGVTFTYTFHPGVAHHHAPTGRWGAIQADARARCAALVRARNLGQALAVECACATLSPSAVMGMARNTIMAPLPLAQRHLDHYLRGRGANLSVNLEHVLRRDAKVRRKLAHALARSHIGHIRIEQSDYDVKDFQFAFGAVDRLDFEVNRRAGLVHVWFMDRYEWHPVGFGHRKLPGDIRRSTNCVHAAAVELKSSGAADYWMVGDVIIPLSLLTGGPSPSPSPPGPTPPINVL